MELPITAAFCEKARTIFSHSPLANCKTASSAMFSTIQHPFQAVTHLWKLIRGSLTPRPPLDYLNAHPPLNMELPNIAAYCNILYQCKNNFLSSSLSSKMFQSFPNHERLFVFPSLSGFVNSMGS
jgi:hypothetical protein